MREYLDPVVKADQSAQYVDDFGNAANNATDHAPSIRAIFQCILQTGLKSIEFKKCHFGVKQVDFLNRTISSEGVSTQTHKVQNFLHKLRFPKSKKALHRYLGFLSYHKTILPSRLKSSTFCTNSQKQKSQSTSPQK